jgi:hypothetical protein
MPSFTNIRSASWKLFNFGGSMTNETTAYGIWHNGGDSYTIAGGTDNHGIQEGFLVDYDSVSKKFSHLTLYEHYLVTHFEGITGTAQGFNLIATTAAGAAFASVTVKPTNGVYRRSVPLTTISTCRLPHPEHTSRSRQSGTAVSAP